MSRSARVLLNSLTDEDVIKLDIILHAASLAKAWGKCPRKYFKAEKKRHSGKIKRMLNAFQKSSDIDLILENHSITLERQYAKTL